MKLLNGCCLEKMKDLSANSVDIVVADLPYGRFKHLAWDSPIDLKKMWKELYRVCKKTAPIFLFGDMKFMVHLINSNPKDFKYEIVWNKCRTTTPLLSRRRLGKATEYVGIWYRKQCPYYYKRYHKIIQNKDKVYDPKLPINVVHHLNAHIPLKDDNWNSYDPKLPINCIQDDSSISYYNFENRPDLYTHHDTKYNPTLPLNIVEGRMKQRKKLIKNITEKPYFILEFILKYFSKEGDVVLDMTMGSGSCGVVALDLKREFVGIELDENHYNIAKKRLDTHVPKKSIVNQSK
tara:strand:+ start:2359 stop:3234 length:876 start_codon:yes stop_codon:yes gene_type:complete